MSERHTARGSSQESKSYDNSTGSSQELNLESSPKKPESNPSNIGSSDSQSVTKRRNSEQFDASQIVELLAMNNGEMKDLEDSIQKEFRNITRDYLKGRLSRINYMIGNFGDHIKQFKENEKAWTKVVQFESETIESVKYSQENVCLNEKTNLKSYQALNDEIEGLLKNTQSPMDIDKYLTKTNDQVLPFSESFTKLISGYARDLFTLSEENRLQTDLIKTHMENSRIIIWQQFRSNLINYKYYLIDKCLEELADIEREEQGLNSSKHKISQWDDYHNSLVSSTKGINSDTRNYIANKFVKRNRVELTNIKLNNLNNKHRFDRSQNNYNPYINPNKRVKLSVCQGLGDDEINDDLFMIKNKVIVDDSDGHDYDLINDKDSSVDGNFPLTPKADELQTEYDRLLNLRTEEDNQKVELPLLPPIECFPLNM
ncbi:hypothetical protein CANTEDRAFT_95854 [Yamadazyma tenuis ATCC 10573]|uniref:Uncharacterized protein n=1 Tax=Candida tenuis (strain ATCC 10573 / BCRC 21748 / CBS 615 / JCM 9827 / NBRC 10315 / NRRL Y-1498 / VKM Y-70) TaxID=590646 RepID=G3BDX4_CANTC|nr:uncharacterized protein CANTEDRAFT_95854 [Yamadazyma tenuis ATCC 10573]EGV60404.1 hypothetical protein CANTEDRAFT_95854 [Yamadazyma tenuis ATCC 10573]